ncbi:hypothetical protein CG471_21735 [Sphingobium sp. IP1]|uniref:hypothetical protein n=1 Tax=Sphingobium sp. IP1 TaxID=2021637 RepID=UPI000C0815BB|nr:hypothetical protein [Sphingobium sp. IP1]PHP17646.1 hypothetical protein CG471_21735 [Sphingobium sp. IP1]
MIKKRLDLKGRSPLAALAERISRVRGEAGTAQNRSSLPDAPSMLEVREACEIAATATLASDDPTPLYLNALRNKIEVEKMSLAGHRVADIAKALGLSCRHVTKLRSELGVAHRKRGD